MLEFLQVGCAGKKKYFWSCLEAEEDKTKKGSLTYAFI